MLKKIRTDQLRLGMHVHRLEGAWLDHPFWKTKFLLRELSDLQSLRSSSVAECWINTAQGLDVADVRAPSPPASLPAPPGVVAAAPGAGAAPVQASIEDESVRAAALCRSARQAVQTLFDDARMGRALETAHCLALVEDIASSVSRNAGALISIARLKAHDDYTYMHSVSVCALMVALARQLGQDEAQVREAGVAGLVHDLGKALMPTAVLNKPGPLTDAEYGVMKTHPQRGHELLAQGQAASAIALDVCLHHHERPDGKGYPDRLAGAALSLHARMGAVCDVYDAITSNRPYKAGWDPAEALVRMADWSRAGQFDAAVLKALIGSIGIHPIGSLVRLQSGRLAVVIEQNSVSLVTPRVKVFYSTRSRLPVPLETLDLSRPGCTERIVDRESNAEWGFPHLAELASSQAQQRIAR